MIRNLRAWLRGIRRQQSATRAQRQIVEFVRAGGLDRAREREKTDLEEERRRLHQEQYAHALRSGSAPVLESHGDPLDYGAILSAARDLLKGMFRH